MWVLAVVEYARARASVKEKGRRLGAVQRKVDEEAIRLQERRQRLQAEESEMGRLKRAYVEVGTEYILNYGFCESRLETECGVL